MYGEYGKENESVLSMKKLCCQAGLFYSGNKIYNIFYNKTEKIDGKPFRNKKNFFTNKVHSMKQIHEWSERRNKYLQNRLSSCKN